uniref:Ig-like domain-containing protein n=1 Tax=Caenorhabditis japonica TaxID=281687 RepID=A0A8R1IWZ2_CAEJA
MYKRHHHAIHVIISPVTRLFPATIPPKVDPIQQTVDRGQPARFKCWVPGNSNVQLKWSRPGGGALPNGVQEQQGILHIPRATEHEAGQYVCTATDPRDNTPLQSEPVSLNIRDPAPQREL